MDAVTTQQDVLTYKDGLAGRLRLNRPKALHSLNRQMVRDMANARPREVVGKNGNAVRCKHRHHAHPALG